MKVLFISRAFPPTVGGIEKQNFEIYDNLKNNCEITLIANYKGKKFLLLFLIMALVKGIVLGRKHDVVLLGDGVLAIVGIIIKLITRTPTVAVAHGLDLTYKSYIYQKIWIGFALKRLTAIFPVSNETKKIAIKKGITAEKCRVIFNGISENKNARIASIDEIQKIVGVKLKNRKILLTVGRLVERKGVHWFVKNVMPYLDDSYLYLIAGDGIMKHAINNEIQVQNLSHKVKLLGLVGDEVRQGLYEASHIFVQPNINVNNDVEGFGLVVLEAATCSLPVIASELQGLKDAVINNKTGFFAKPENPTDFIEIIKNLMEDHQYREQFGIQARELVLQEYGWNKVAGKYIQHLKEFSVI